MRGNPTTDASVSSSSTCGEAATSYSATPTTWPRSTGVMGLIRNPRGDLGRIRGYIQDTFRRLYNQRNLVMHGGTFRSIALRATLRTAPPLVGAGLDRIVRAQLGSDRRLTALQLSARAETELDLVGSDGEAWLVDLLGR